MQAQGKNLCRKRRAEFVTVFSYLSKLPKFSLLTLIAKDNSFAGWRNLSGNYRAYVFGADIDDSRSALLVRDFFQVVSPILGLAAFALSCTISAAVCPCAAQCILFCTRAKKFCDGIALRS